MTKEDVMLILKKYCANDLTELSENTYEDLIVEPLCDADEEIDIVVNNGSSKLVLEFSGISNLVFKIPFRYAEDGYTFSGSTGDEEKWNYCNAEISIFKKLPKVLKQFFVSTELIGYVGNMPIYTQEKVDIKYHKFNRNKALNPIVKKSLKNKEIGFDIMDCNEWLEDFLDYWGEHNLNLLLSGIKKYNITDIHSGNVGYINNKPVIFDYGGFDY